LSVLGRGEKAEYVIALAPPPSQLPNETNETLLGINIVFANLFYCVNGLSMDACNCRVEYWNFTGGGVSHLSRTCLREVFGVTPFRSIVY
jgi:hypothetical protein